nr:FbpB family small basic protein [Halobacillus sp. Marseille-P3879]
MMRTNRISFEELVDQNKQKLLNDQQALDKIDEHLDEKRVNNSDQNKMIN